MISAPGSSVSPRESSRRILAIDYGRKRMGLALADELGLTVRPLGTLVRRNRRDDLRQLGEIVRENQVRRIVVGYPLHLNGAPGEMAAETARFASRIERQLGLPVELVDERLSSWEAEQMVLGKTPARKGTRRARAKGTGTPARKRAGEFDHVAAAVILRSYLERQRERTEG